MLLKALLKMQIFPFTLPSLSIPLSLPSSSQSKGLEHANNLVNGARSVPPAVRGPYLWTPHHLLLVPILPWAPPKSSDHFFHADVNYVPRTGDGVCAWVRACVRVCVSLCVCVCSFSVTVVKSRLYLRCEIQKSSLRNKGSPPPMGRKIKVE